MVPNSLLCCYSPPIVADRTHSSTFPRDRRTLVLKQACGMISHVADHRRCILLYYTRPAAVSRRFGNFSCHPLRLHSSTCRWVLEWIAVWSASAPAHWNDNSWTIDHKSSVIPTWNAKVTKWMAAMLNNIYKAIGSKWNPIKIFEPYSTLTSGYLRRSLMIVNSALVISWQFSCCVANARISSGFKAS